MMEKIKAFTAYIPRKSLQLTCSVMVKNDPRMVMATALWDTGATTSMVATDVAEHLGLKDSASASIQTPTGISDIPTCYADIELPNGVTIDSVRMVKAPIQDQGIGLIIGMDIISQGDFAISNRNNMTQFTFRMPSVADADYTKPS